MQRSPLSTLLSSLLCVALGCSAATQQDADRASAPEPGASQADDATADVAITPDSVYGKERYWPAIVAMTQDWLPPGETVPLQAQYRGTLVRVEADGRVRIDFGRHGKHDVPMDHTDLVERANEVRAGSQTKLAPNFVLRVGNSLLDSSSESIRPYKLGEIAGASGYLCVFADPRADDFPILAQQLAVLEGMNGVRTVFFPQSVVREDAQFVHEGLGKLSWRVAYMYPRLSGNYTLSLLGEIPERPRAQLVSPEGRVIHQAEIGTADGLSELQQAVESVPPAPVEVERVGRSGGEEEMPAPI